jgi:hypothetical protein
MSMMIETAVNERAERQYEFLSLRSACAVLGIPLAEWAAKADLSRQLVDRYSSGVKVPSPEALARLREALQLPDQRIVQAIIRAGDAILLFEKLRAAFVVFMFTIARRITGKEYAEPLAADPEFYTLMQVLDDLKRAMRLLCETQDIAFSIPSRLTLDAAQDATAWGTKMRQLLQEADETKRLHLVEILFGLHEHVYKEDPLAKVLAAQMAIIAEMIENDPYSQINRAVDNFAELLEQQGSIHAPLVKAFENVSKIASELNTPPAGWAADDEPASEHSDSAQ